MSNGTGLMRDLVPPILWKAAGRARRLAEGPAKEADTALFDGQDALFLAAVDGVTVYGEYGMGASTRWMAANTQARIRSVDTSREWRDATSEAIGPSDRVELTWIDVGPIAGWGMPATYSRRAAFRSYVEAIWPADAPPPETILIDGRFRLSCWFHCVAVAEPGTRIVFDDYVARPPFHVVEEWQAPERTNERQALFVVPERVDRASLEAARDAFLMVRD